MQTERATCVARFAVHHLALMTESPLGFVVGMTLQLMVMFPDVPELAPITDPEERAAAFAAWEAYKGIQVSLGGRRGKRSCFELPNYIRAVLGSAEASGELIPE